MANSWYFFSQCFSLVVPLPRVGIIFEPFPVSLFSVGTAQGRSHWGISLFLYAEPARFDSDAGQHPFQTTTLLHARLLSMWLRRSLLLYWLLFSYRDRRHCRGSHCHSNVDGMAGSRWWQRYKTWSVNGETWLYHRRRCHFRRSVNTV